jgi:hypothetical protein
LMGRSPHTAMVEPMGRSKQAIRGGSVADH